MRSVLHAALNLLFPARCPACGTFTHEAGLCNRCKQDLRLVAPPLCPICGLPFPGRARDHSCPVCHGRRRRFDRARACFVYERGLDDGAGTLARVLHDYKYRRDVTLAPVLADLMIRGCPLRVAHDLIVPVPLHRDRLRWRGFNQSLLLARRVGRHFNVPVDPFTLIRTRPTPPQVGLAEADRRRNVAGAFGVARTAAVAGQHTLLVDDVYTTGATVEECARVLKRAGARRVDVLVLARVV